MRRAWDQRGERHRVARGGRPAIRGAITSRNLCHVTQAVWQQGASCSSTIALWRGESGVRRGHSRARDGPCYGRDSRKSAGAEKGARTWQIAFKEFLHSARELVPKGFVGEAEVQQAIQYVSEAVAAIYNNYRTDVSETRHAIQTRLEGAKWPEFPELSEIACSSGPNSRAVAAEPLVKTLAEMAHELGTMAPSKDSIGREVALKEARISLMREGWKPEWGNYDDFLRWVTKGAARDPSPATISAAAAIYRGQAK